MVTKYCPYKVLNYAEKLQMQYIPFKLLSVLDTAEYIQQKTKQNAWYKNLSKPETDNQSKDLW